MPRPRISDASRAEDRAEEEGGSFSQVEFSQSAFAEALLDPAAPLPEGLRRPGRAEPRKRFAVYRNNVLASLTEALAQAYPTVRRLVGDAFFNAMAGVFVRAHPPRSPVMLEYGDAFPDWVAGFEPARSLPYLADVARIDRARLEAYHAADAPPLTAERASAAFAGRDAEEIAAARLTPHPSLRLLSLGTPALTIWRLAQEGKGGAAPSGAERVIVVRPDMTVALRAAPAASFAFLSALASGYPIASAAERAEAAASEAGGSFDLAAALGEAFQAGFFASVALAPQGAPADPAPGSP